MMESVSSSTNDYMSAWKAFEENCRSCNACGLRSNANNVVIFRGARNAPLMVIGEAPGEEEDKQGMPFVGKSGQLLQNLLNSFGIDESICHICNIVKCRPPDNRRPESTEIAACKRHLASQFKLVRPKVILLCGSTAYEAFFGVKPVMKEVRGTVIQKNGFHIITTFHPAYALRNEAGKAPIYDDVKLVKNKLIELGCINL